MTTPPHAPTGSSASAAPVGCPAHARAAGGLRPLYGPEAEAQPYALYEQLRKEHGAVAPVLLYGGVPAWLVLGHRENLEVMRSPRFSSDSRHWHAVREGSLSADSPLLPITAWQPLVALTDGAEHARLRQAVTESLARVNRHRLRRYITRYTTRLIDDFASAGRADLVDDFARKLPALVVCQQFGIREEDALTVGAAVSDMVGGGESALRSNQLVVGMMDELVRHKKQRPGDDLASWLLVHPSGLTEEEVREHLRLALVAALEPTANLIANTLRMVLTDRRFRGHLSGGQMTLPDALDHVLWDHPPLSVVPTRWATGDTRLGGRHIMAGDMVMLGLAAGNVDPGIRPDLTVPMHGNRSHLSFGAGPHECPGQDLGRAIAETGIDLLLERVPDLRLSVTDDELRVVGTWMSRRLTGLPVTFTPQARPRAVEGVERPGPAPARTGVVPAPPERSRGRWFRRR
ncbi:cytochrome P450 [Streptomyces lavendofoliae]|uniref:Cytochrome P450 n=1 Tax=Streptomyces lavendofoliae TaxID=67314 RepID=A0A918M4E3_9ACTN|nr:cytochrome P450 [Streptomyces lavendofoliae]GGU38034.1 cytochrome P450 [Streptomyces lavendofoliae]